LQIRVKFVLLEASPLVVSSPAQNVVLAHIVLRVKALAHHVLSTCLHRPDRQIAISVAATRMLFLLTAVLTLRPQPANARQATSQRSDQLSSLQQVPKHAQPALPELFQQKEQALAKIATLESLVLQLHRHLAKEPVPRALIR